MKIKSLIIFLVISSFFLTCILSIWKIMSTLQGLSFTNLNITPVFLIGILLSLVFVLIGNRINHLIKIFSLSFLFSILYFYLNEASPYWYIFGVFLITLFFTNKLKKYSMQSLKEDFISEKIIFDFITLFGIVFFAFVILFPFYIMLVTSFKTQIALLVNPLDFSLDFTKSLTELFKSYFVIFKTYNFGRYILISSVVSIGTVIVMLLLSFMIIYFRLIGKKTNED